MAAAHGGPVAARRILITVGERADESAAVFRWAAAHFLEARDELTLLHVHTGGVLSLTPHENVSSEPLPWVPAEAARAWSTFRSARAVEVNSPLLLPMGDALIDWLAHLSPAEEPDVVIAGSRGHDSRLARFFLGSVTSYLVQQGEANLLVVRPSAQASAMAEPQGRQSRPEEIGAMPRKVALALDAAADTARSQVRWAIQYVLRSTDEVKVLHAPTTAGEMNVKHDNSAFTQAAVILRDAVDQLAPFVDASQHRPASVLFSSKEGPDVRDCIVDYVNQNGVDLLILGRRSVETKVRKPSTGSVSSYCLHHCKSAVLVVNETTLFGANTL